MKPATYKCMKLPVSAQCPSYANMPCTDYSLDQLCNASTSVMKICINITPYLRNDAVYSQINNRT